MASTGKKKHRKQWGGPMHWLIFLPFLLIGIFLLCFAATNVQQHLSAQSWQPVQATMLARGVSHEITADGRAKIGGTSRMSGAYAYAWQGKRYESDQLSFSKMRTRNIDPGDWEARLDELLGPPGSTFTAYVNPLAPAQAVVLRDVRWFEVGVAIGFGLLLVFLMSALLFGGDPNQSKAAFSWRAVGIMWVVGCLMAVLCPLLWRDGHPVWAAICALPLLLALHGTVHGIQLMRHTG